MAARRLHHTPDRPAQAGTPDAEKIRDRTNSGPREEVLRIFQQTFAVTNTLRIIGLGVAGLGLALSQ